jgi:hypothetical protein
MMANPAESADGGDVLTEMFSDTDREQMTDDDAGCWRDVVVILLSVITMGVTLMTIAVVSIYKFGG